MREQDIFIEAMERENPGDRRKYLDETCGDDSALRERVETLIRQSDQLGSFMEHPPVNSTSDETGAKPASGFERTILESSDSVSEQQDGGQADEDGEEVSLSFLEPSSDSGSLGRLGHYEIQDVIGKGAFGIVLKAFDEKLQRVVAIKVLAPEMATTSPARKRFLREARSSAAVRHDNVVSIYAVEDNPLPYLVMEYIPGQTLQQRLDGTGPLDIREILRLGRQVAEGLAAAHGQGLIHRDIKPCNILLDTSVGDHVKITDFGLARTADDASLTQSGIIAGTPMYMAPEQARGETLDHRADLFSLGSVLYQMVSGRPPFRASNTVAVLKRVCDDTPRPIQDIIPETPVWLSKIILRLLEKDRDDRFQIAKEVAQVLADCETELEASGTVKSASMTSSVVSADDEPQQSAKATAQSIDNTRSESRRNRGIILGLLVGVVVFVSVQVIAPWLARQLDTPIPALSADEQTGGLQFDGRDDWVQVSGLEWNYPQFTIEAFVTSKAGSDNGTIVLLRGGKGESAERMSLFDGGQAGPNKRVSGAAVIGQTSYENAYGPFAAGQRQHRALVFDGRYLHYFINGVWQGERYAAAHEGMQWQMDELRIGCDGSGRRFFEGLVDQLRVSRVARYSESFPPVESVSSDDVTLALYNFDENSGSVLKDASGNGNDGTIHGATWMKIVGAQ